MATSKGEILISKAPGAPICDLAAKYNSAMNIWCGSLGPAIWMSSPSMSW